MNGFDYVYLLVDEDGWSFKIGRSRDPANRAMWLRVRVDFGRSRHYRLTGRDGRRLEYMLHFMFRAYQVDKPRRDGSTEWFDMEAFDDVVAFMDAFRDRIGWDLCEPVTRRTPGQYQALRDEGREARNAAQREAYARDKALREAAKNRPPRPRREPPPRRSESPEITAA